ncbi:similar to Saccharomyces cerevisiae YBL058W SHP1 UBX (ubiquitin regulatory X) domain-containing protein that regulates Glc7p phosphatase activity and interacts with Cdc48p [Maudiozyma saulgeensis]|uniref:Similar to Saccharomyces cerevisiae YBL058W SHP1 UBX (Ubiquitin regulatory X) domain-containing protein that regulates Glc7p phosphatase activity and interacts with Cdc48p n=1 Tax=Maudiozyma saulgeensis TaxID=1789683 RepID=A0A1X7R4P2_9SACH|nr:similar to Saccharomyces cerevisiae YBL058W SHP1 UBX (ubiquitin regulatory X) domain-containing protein that regulates Glc7p phosphatase activity and interacts with Cdc48p [Kazachstania saulgeensis]
MSNNTEEIDQFITMTNASRKVATEYIKTFGDLESAIEGYFAAQSNEVLSSSENEREATNDTMKSMESFGERPLGIEHSGIQSSGSVHQSSRNNKSSSNNNSKFMSFSDMVRNNADEEDDEDRPRNTFAGGETSGLEVTDPNDSNSLIKDLLEKAKRGGERASNGNFDDNESAQPQQSQFEGRGYRLGSVVDAPSSVVEDNPHVASTKKEKVKREITFWKEGFQVGDGQLYRYDDPKYAHYLQELNQGRAPLNLLDVEYGQDVDVTVFKKLDESFKPSKKPQVGFQGKGQRLGSPIPGELEEPTFTQPVKIHNANDDKSSSVETEKEKPEVKGDTSIQIRYASGKREVYRCNSTDTVQSLYDYVKQNTLDQSRAFTLNHAFPVKVIDQYDSTIADADLKNAVVVQRWVM